MRKRSKNPVKKKRSAKQLANDKRLSRMAKARGKKKVARRTNPKHSVNSHLWLIFIFSRGKIYYITEKGRSHKKGEALLFQSKQQANNYANQLNVTAQLGITTYSTTPAQIKTALKEKA